MNMKHGLFGRVSALALCACSLSAFGMTEMIPQFGKLSSWAVTRDKPTDEQHLTMTAWFKVTAEQANGSDLDCIISTSARNSRYGLMTLFYNNQNGANAAKNGLGFFGFPLASDASYTEYSYKKPLNDGAWHFAAATLSGATYTLYLDGEPVGTVEATAERVAGKSFANGVAFGADIGSGKRNFGGYVTEASLWSAALSADQVKALYTNGTRLSGQETGLWGYWPLNDESGTGVRDASGNNHKMTYSKVTDIPITEVETPFTAVSAPVTVKFESAEGASYGDAVTVIPNTASTAVPDDPFEAGFVFTGWSRDQGATVLSAAEVAEVKLAEATTWVAQFQADSRPVYDLPEVVESAAYTGVEQKPTVAESEGYTVAWTGDWTHVGEHTLTLTLTDPEGSCWDDGTTEVKTYTCIITQATNGWTVEPTVAIQWETGTTPDVSLGMPAFGEVVMTPTDLAALPTGAAKVTFTVAATADYAALEKTIDVFVVPQGLTPTGDPDTAATTYTWNGAETGYWYDPANWATTSSPCFGFPASGVATAYFENTTATVEGNTIPYELAKLQVKSSNVTLKGGDYTLPSGGLVLEGTNQKVLKFALALVDGAKLTVPGSSVIETAWAGSSIAVTNATLNATFVVRATQDFSASFHNATVNGGVTFGQSTTYPLNQSLVFSGAESQINLVNNASFGNNGVSVRFEEGVDVTFTGWAPVGKNSRVTFVGKNAITVGTRGSVGLYGDNAEIFYGDGVTGDVADFGMYRQGKGLSNARTVVSNATLSVWDQLYMPNPNNPQKEGCGVTFMGESPKVNVFKKGNIANAAYLGKATLAEGEVLPSWRYVLPKAPYASAPLAIDLAANMVFFTSNTPFEFDVTAVKAKGRYPLISFANAPATVDVAQLTAASSAWTTRADGSHRDAAERVKLGWDAEAKTIYADVTQSPGMTLLVR